MTPIKGKKDQTVLATFAENPTLNPQYGTITFVAKTLTNDSIVKVINVTQLDFRSQESTITEKVFPNPTRDEVNIQLSALREERLDVRLYDASGRMIKVLEQDKPIFGAYYNSYHLNDLLPGFYTMQIKHGDSITREKLVILN